VMVWFHGGGFQSGAGSVYDPTPLVTKGKVIVVTVNYRLGAFGYLALPGLTSEPGAQSIGNVGFLDQQASLRWVHDNIGVFGGNAGNVTIFGQSAGAHSTCMHMIAPSSAGLFQKAISESGGCIETPIGPGTVAKAYDKGERFATAVGCTDPATVVSCLRGKPYADLVKASGSPLENGDTWFPTLDGKVITQTPRAALTSGKYNHVPLILGSNKDEGRLFVALTYHLLKGRPSTAAELVEGIKTLKADASQELIDGYHPASSSNADLALARVFTDGIFACPDLRLAKAVTSQPAPAVYHYEFADPDPQGSYLDLSMKLGDFHGSELPYLFDMVQGMTTSQKNLSDQMVKYWTTFAKTGNPNGSGTPVWPAFTAGSEQAQRLTSEGTRPISTFSAEHRCRLWG
jgi:para-nitrobenzyl esterase